MLSFVTMLSVLSVPLMINPNSPTMITVDIAYRINTHADYGVANALCLASLALAAAGAWFYLRHAVVKSGGGGVSHPARGPAQRGSTARRIAARTPTTRTSHIDTRRRGGGMNLTAMRRGLGGHGRRPGSSSGCSRSRSSARSPTSRCGRSPSAGTSRTRCPRSSASRSGRACSVARGGALAALGTSVWIAVLTVALSLAVAIPAGYALARLKLRWRGLILLAFLLPQAVPNLPIYVNIARVFYELGIAGTITGVVLVHASHGLVLAVWIASAAFAAVDPSMEEAARNLGASPLETFRTITLPLAAPGLMASAIFVFLESLDEFTGTYFVGVPDVTTLPLLMFNASMGGNYQIASITALLLLVPSIGFMLVVERFLKANVLAMVGR